jgi:hypothetical protein
MQYQAGNCETHRHFSPNTAFKMIEEIEDELTLKYDSSRGEARYDAAGAAVAKLPMRSS